MKDLLHLKHSKDGYGTISKQEKHLRASKYGRIRYSKDTILKTERRLLIEITYNLEKNMKEYFESLQLNLFDNENNR